MKQKVSAVQSTAKRRYTSAKLKSFQKIKNYFEWLLCSDAGLTDYQLFILMRKGGAL